MSNLREIVFGWYLPVFGWGLFAVLLSLAGMLICRGLSAGADAPAARRDSSWLGRGVSVAFFCIAIVCGAIKPGSMPTITPAPRAQVRMVNAASSISAAEETAMAEADEGMLLIGNWFRSGGRGRGHVVSFDHGWVFPYGTNHLPSVEIWPTGAVYAGMKDPTPIAAISVPLSPKPQVTRVYCGFTTNDSYRVEWREAYANRDHNQPMNAAIDLHRDGHITITENGVTNTIDRVLPFAHDGYGQDDDWVRANFTNAEEIISVGYANWVDAQVGIGLTNGLYKFTATFVDDPPEATEFHIGDYSICVTNAGEYVFLLEKGTGYEFGTWPYDESVDYFVQDDMADGAPMLAASWGGWESPGEWSVEGGWWWLYYPSLGNPDYCNWMPTLQGSPNVSHLGSANLPMTFTAILTDYCGGATPVFRWSASDENLQFDSPNAQTTTVSCASLPSWGTLSLSVRADLGGYSLWSYLYPTYGTIETPQVALDLSAPQVVFLNDDERSTRYYNISLAVDCSVSTNVTVTISHNGETGARFFSDAQGENDIALPTNLSCAVDGSRRVVLDGYMSCSRLGSGSLQVACTTADGEPLGKETAYEVIEPLRKLITNVRAEDGGIANPSRLVYGTNAWLMVDRNGSFPADNIRWRIVSGPGEFVSTNRYWACVRATEPSGTVVVEAAFGDDASVQPQFVLPIIAPREIGVKVCVVADDKGAMTVSEDFVEMKIEYANNIFFQTGIRFVRKHPISVITNSTFMVIEVFQRIANTNNNTRSSKRVSDQVLSLLSQSSLVPEEEIKLFFVQQIRGGGHIAFTAVDKKSCVFASVNQGTGSVTAHELGHTMGLQDIYNICGQVEMPDGRLPLCASMFSNNDTDWTGDAGRGFYEIYDTRQDVLEMLLMFGLDNGGTDIPDGNVLGYPANAGGIFDLRYIPVGASSIR